MNSKCEMLSIGSSLIPILISLPTFKEMIREGLPEEVTFEWSSEGGEGSSQKKVLGNGVPGRGIHRCSSPEAGTCLTCSRKIQATVQGEGVG